MINIKYGEGKSKLDFKCTVPSMDKFLLEAMQFDLNATVWGYDYLEDCINVIEKYIGEGRVKKSEMDGIILRLFWYTDNEDELIMLSGFPRSFFEVTIIKGGDTIDHGFRIENGDHPRVVDNYETTEPMNVHYDTMQFIINELKLWAENYKTDILEIAPNGKEEE